MLLGDSTGGWVVVLRLIGLEFGFQLDSLFIIYMYVMYIYIYIYIRGQSIKKPNFFCFLIYCFTYNLIKLVSFKVLPSIPDTPLPTFFPVLERILERVLQEGAKVP
jgi:hypothetical protein